MLGVFPSLLFRVTVGALLFRRLPCAPVPVRPLIKAVLPGASAMPLPVLPAPTSHPAPCAAASAFNPGLAAHAGQLSLFSWSPQVLPPAETFFFISQKRPAPSWRAFIPFLPIDWLARFISVNRRHPSVRR